MALDGGTWIARHAAVVRVPARRARALAWRSALVVAAAAATHCAPPPSPPAQAPTTRALSTFDQGGVMSGDAARTGWYPDEPLLDPSLVGSSSFGQVFSAPVDGQIYAQPLYANGTLLVATETNHVYGLDAATGAQQWMRQLEVPWQASDLACGNLAPTVGVTGTPAIDPATGTAYLFAKTYANGASGPAAWVAHALDLATGAERPGFPVTIGGPASNEPAQVFDATHQLQRPGLLFMNGVVYAAFGSHCDLPPYAGWVVGVSTAGVVTTMWTSESGPNRTAGGGIWMSGGALVSDGDGQILFATGNDASGSTTPLPGHTPPDTLAEAVVRLRVQADGSLQAADFFAPAETPTLNLGDTDLGAGAPIAMPAVFGTPAHPNVLAQAGKSGYVYLLDRDDLGGYLQGPTGTDKVLARLGPDGGVWSRPSVWPGDGGYLYLPVVSGCSGPTDPAGCLRAFQRGVTGDGTPTLALSATSTGSFGYGSSAVVVTSDGMRSGSALLWTIWASGPVSTTSELRAYDAVPNGDALKVRFLAGVGTGGHFTAPGVGGGRIYVGSGDGHVLGFGVTGGAPLRASGEAFAPTVVGDTRVSNVQLTASGPVTLAALEATGDFALTPDAPSVPLPMAAGDVVSVPVAFRPTVEGPDEGTLAVTTEHGTLTLTLSGVGQSAVPRLTASPAVMSFSPIVKGNDATQTVVVTNVAATPLTITAVASPKAPFSIEGLPAVGAQIAAGEAIDVTVHFAPTTVGSSASTFGVTADGADVAVAVEGTALAGGQLRIAPTQLDLGVLTVGTAVLGEFQLANVGDAPVTIEKSQAPSTRPFQPLTSLPEGTVLAPGAASEEVIRVSPDIVGPETDVWRLNASDGLGLRELVLSVTGSPPPVVPPPASSSGSAGTGGSTAQMTEPPNTDSPELAQNHEEDPAVTGHACDVGAGEGAPGAGGLALAAAAVVSARRRRRSPSRAV